MELKGVLSVRSSPVFVRSLSIPVSFRAEQFYVRKLGTKSA